MRGSRPTRRCSNRACNRSSRRRAWLPAPRPSSDRHNVFDPEDRRRRIALPSPSSPPYDLVKLVFSKTGKCTENLMSQFQKTPLVVVATILMGTVISQNLSGKDQPLQRAILKKEVDSAEEKILAALDKPTNVEFLDLALEDCRNYLKEYHQINVWVDKQTLAEDGVSLDQPMTLKLADVRLESILNLLLEPLQLDWIVQDEVRKITTSGW